MSRNHCQCKGPEGKLKADYSSMDHLSLITKKQSDIRCASWHNTMVNWCQLQEMYHNGMARQKHNNLQ